MNAFELLGMSPAGYAARAWACGVCMNVRGSKEMADRCCRCHICGEVVEADKYGNRETEHKACRDKRHAEQAQERINKATKLADWAGGVFWNDTYYASMDEAVDDMECQLLDSDDWPEFVYVAKRSPPKHLEVGRILEDVFDCIGADDDPLDYLKGIPELTAACEAFNEVNSKIQWYTEDNTRMAIVPPREVEDE